MSSSLEAERCQRIEEVVASRDSINSLPNDLLIQILLLVPTKDAVATMILSKRWRYIWTLVPELEYKDTDDEGESVWKFLDKLLELHKAPVLENLCIQLGKKCPIDVDVGKLIAKAVDRFVRKLGLELLWTAEPTSLPKSLYTCKTLVELTLSNKILVDVPSSVYLPSLRILRLLCVVFKGEDSLERLVSSCSVLARSRVFLGISDFLRHPFPMVNKFRFDKPYILVFCNTDDKFLGTISLVTSLFLSFKDPEVSGNLPGYLPLPWYQPSFVPRCFSSHLEIFQWVGYTGNEEEKKLMRYILANSKCLKTVTITLISTFNPEEKEMAEKELKSMARVSTISELLVK